MLQYVLTHLHTDQLYIKYNSFYINTSILHYRDAAKAVNNQYQVYCRCVLINNC